MTVPESAVDAGSADTPRAAVRAIGSPRAGGLAELAWTSVELPATKQRQVEIQVVASAVNAADLKVHRGEFAGRVLHARTRPLITGYDFSGVVRECGDEIDDLRPGDRVFGFLPYSSRTRQGAFAERVVVDRSTIAAVPESIDHPTAAAMATAGLTAVQALRDRGGLRAADRLLVIGAAGGVGSLAVGVGGAMGAHVVGVCSGYAVNFVRSLGAEEVVDRGERDLRQLAGEFKVILDTAAAYSYAQLSHLLTRDGVYVTTLPSLGLVGGKLMAALSRRRCTSLVVTPRAADLELLASYVVAGMRVPIDSSFPLGDLARAFAQMAHGRLLGRIVVDVSRAPAVSVSRV